MEEEYFEKLRKKMVEHQITARGVSDQRVLEAMLRVPRHLFIPESMQDRAYDDSPLPIGDGQTISQPYMVAWMTELLAVGEEDKVLEIGTGSGYQAANWAGRRRPPSTVSWSPPEPPPSPSP